MNRIKKQPLGAGIEKKPINEQLQELRAQIQKITEASPVNSQKSSRWSSDTKTAPEEAATSSDSGEAIRKCGRRFAGKDSAVDVNVDADVGRGRDGGRSRTSSSSSSSRTVRATFANQFPLRWPLQFWFQRCRRYACREFQMAVALVVVVGIGVSVASPEC